MILKGDSGDRASCIPPVATCFGTFVLFPLICFGVRKMGGGGGVAARKGIFLDGEFGR